MDTESHSLLAASPADLRALRNLLLVRWEPGDIWPSLPALQRQLRGFRSRHPRGSAILNVVGNGDPVRIRDGFSKLNALFLGAPEVPGETPSPIHLGTAHLFVAVGLRGALLDSVFAGLARPNGDFTKSGNKMVGSIDEAAEWLAERLASGEPAWSVDEVRQAIVDFLPNRPDLPPA